MAWYRLDKKEVLRQLGTDVGGLSGRHAKERASVYGSNDIIDVRRQSYLSLLLEQFTSFLPWLLFCIGLLALAADYFLGMDDHFFDAIVIFFILFTNAFLVAYQERKSNRDARKLEVLHETDCSVLRDGKVAKVHIWSVVPGDVVMLSKGMKVPADARILSSNNLEVDEALLTGESMPMAKRAGTIDGEVPLDEQFNMVFRNTFVLNGTAKVVVVATGEETEAGKLAKSLLRKAKSPFVKELDNASNKITMIAVSLIFMVVLLFMAQGFAWTEIVLMAAALLIGAIPEALPAIVSFSIAASRKKLLKQNVLAKKHTLIETLGSIDVICVDKTGTLTTNRLSIKEFVIADRKVPFDKLPDLAKEHFANAALLANESQASPQGYVGDDIDIAFIDFFNGQGYDLIEFYKGHARQRLNPFSSETKSISATFRQGKRTLTYTKGAPEHMINRCGKLLVGDKVLAFTKRRKERAHAQVSEFSHASLRSVGLSYKQGKEEVFIGLVGMYDPPKEGLHGIIGTLYDAGVAIKIITGDHQETALSIAKTCGFKQTRSMDWEDIKDMSAEQLKEVVEEHDIFTRMSPENKLRIVKALQENGHRVAITGDGVNDVPALQEAEVGIAMGEHSADMAKDAADLIIMDDNLQSIVAGIKEGRTIFYNIRKVINYLMTANLGEILLVVLGSFFGLMPFLPVQLLWVNFAANYAPALALGIDPSPPGIMTRKPTGKHEHFITQRLAALAVYISLKKVVLLSALFYGSYALTGDLMLAQTVAFTWLVMWHFVRILTIKFDERQPVTANPFLVVALLVPLFLQLIILYTPIGHIFRVVPLSLGVWSVLVATMLVGIYLERFIALFVRRTVKMEDGSY